jgi:uncharacterized integral membrane protein (TIGR00697 family)
MSSDRLARSKYEFVLAAEAEGEDGAQSLLTARPTTASRYYETMISAFVCVLLCGNLMGTKVSQLSLCLLNCVEVSFGAGIIFFPISYLFGDVAVEVYGQQRARQMLWTGFGALLFAALASWAIVALPAAPEWPGQEAFQSVFGATPRVATASVIAYTLGEFLNVILFARLRAYTQGRFLWLRVVASTAVGAGIDTLVFYPCAFYGVVSLLYSPEVIADAPWRQWPNSVLTSVMLANYRLCSFSFSNGHL